MAQLFLEGITVEALSDIIRETVQAEVCRKQSGGEVSSDTDDVFLTRSEAAQRLRVSLVTLTQWVNCSQLRAYKIITTYLVKITYPISYVSLLLSFVSLLNAPEDLQLLEILTHHE